MINQMETRFKPLERQCLKLQILIPSLIGSFSDLLEAVDLYKDDICTTPSVLKGEFERWCVKWAAETSVPSNVLDTLALCEAICFPNIHILLRLFATLPVTTSTSERSFSTLRRLLTYLRSTMEEDRLVGLTHLTCNKDIEIDIDEVIDELAKKKRRLKFVL